MHLANRLHLGELGEHQGNRLLDAPIGIGLNAVAAGAHVADGHRHEQLAAARLLLQCLKRALAQHRELHLGYGPFHTEQQAIIGMTRIVDAILVDDQRSHQAAELKQRVPVTAIAGEPRGLDRNHRADPTFADRREQLLEPGPRDAAAGAAEIIIDHRNVGLAELAGPIDQPILAPLALQVVDDLIRRRLANVNDGLTSEVLRRDLAHEPPPVFRDRVMAPAPRCCRRPRPEDSRSGGRGPASAGWEASSSPDLARTGPSDGSVLGVFRRAIFL